MTDKIRNASATLLFLVCLVTLTSAFNLPNRSPDLSSRLASPSSVARPAQQQRTMLTLADRVAYQRAIEEVYWRHRIWPKDRPDPKPSLDGAMPPAQLEKKVEDYLRNSQALEDYWQQPLSAGQLQAEMERTAQHTKQPEVLRELFEALGNDPFVIAECLARPILAERRVSELTHYADDGRTAILKSDARTPRTPKDCVRKPEDVMLFREALGVRARPRVVLTLYPSLRRIALDARDEVDATNLAKAEPQVPVTMAAVSANYTLPVIASPSGGCTDDTWTSTTTAHAPLQRRSHTAVWTGSEMIVWGGGGHTTLWNTGGRYNPSTDSWTATSTTNAPPAREFHTAIWTGSEMIVWGGWDGGSEFNTGGKYNPGTDSWTATSTTNAPPARFLHTAVWSGSEMIVWGGIGDLPANTGGRYNPGTDSWTATSTTNAPDARFDHTAVWTGSEMILWGGHFCAPNCQDFNNGSRYNPSTDAWTATSTTNAPDARYVHTAVWTGSEMIVWGGENSTNFFNTGGRYNPSTDSWTATSTTNAPTAREFHTAIWTGSEMIVWGGDQAYPYFDTGGRYNPSTDSWTATSTTNVPAARTSHTAVWTGSEMIVWGGLNDDGNLNTGGRYCAQSQAPMAQSAFSRKTQGAAGTFDVPLPLTGNVGVECRSGGATNDYQMIINFMTSVTVESASVTSGTGSVTSFSVSGSQVTVNLTGVTNVQTITVTLHNVNDGTNTGDVPVSMGVLVGDVNGNAVVNASDVSLTKSQVGQAVSGSNFREDVNANGTISATDVALVKAEVGTALPP